MPPPPTSPQKVWDIARERLAHVCRHHAKGVHSFVWCRAYSLFASCGMERDVTVWQVRRRGGVGSERGGACLAPQRGEGSKT